MLGRRVGTLSATISGVLTMLRLTPRRRAVLADKVPDIANIVAGAAVIGFAFGEPEAPWPVVIAAIAMWAGALVFALVVAEDKP